MASRDLRSKLRRNFGVAEEAAPVEPQTEDAKAEPSQLRAFLERQRERLIARASSIASERSLSGGTEKENDKGRFWLRRERLPLSGSHGDVALGDVVDVDFEALRVHTTNTDLSGAALARCLFLDTETTGLSGGAGTTVFLTGMGFVEGDELILEQVFLRSFAEEPAALSHVAQRLAERPLQVTFVGKSFDRHRLAARMTLHRIHHAMLDPRHLDLFHLARRVWKSELPDTRLRTIEQHKLGLVRHDDLPGSEAPRAWLDWLRDGTGAVDRVMEHNRLDVLSLVALLAVLGRPRAE